MITINRKTEEFFDNIMVDNHPSHRPAYSLILESFLNRLSFNSACSHVENFFTNQFDKKTQYGVVRAYKEHIIYIDGSSYNNSLQKEYNFLYR